MAELLIPPINPNAKTIIDLDRGQQIIIDRDTHFGRVRSRLNDVNPATAIKLEPFGICWSFTLEEGVWWHNEYVGDAQRVPQLHKRIRTKEEERIRREEARKEWEEHMRDSMPNPEVPLNQAETQHSPSYCDHDLQDARRIPEPAVHIQQNAQANSFPEPHFFSANTSNHTPNFGPPHTFHQTSPPPPSFPPSFPFVSDISSSGSPSHGFPTPSHSPGPSLSRSVIPSSPAIDLTHEQSISICHEMEALKKSLAGATHRIQEMEMEIRMLTAAMADLTRAMDICRTKFNVRTGLMGRLGDSIRLTTRENWQGVEEEGRMDYEELSEWGEH